VNGEVPCGMTWWKSSACEGGACVEVAMSGPAVMVRQSLDPGGVVLIFSRDQWRAFVAVMRCGLQA